MYDKLRMFNGQAASWAWYGAGPGASHLGLTTGPASHPALTHTFQANREILEDKKPGQHQYNHLKPGLRSQQYPNTFIKFGNLLKLLNILKKNFPFLLRFMSSLQKKKKFTVIM